MHAAPGASPDSRIAIITAFDEPEPVKRCVAAGADACLLKLLAESCSNRLISERLFIAETTVKSYVSSLLEKLGAQSRLQAVIRATESGLI